MLSTSFRLLSRQFFVKFAAPSPGYNPAEETVLLVDEQNQPVGTAPRHQMREQRLIHRSTFVFIRHPEYYLHRNKLYVQQRVHSKDLNPGYFDPATGGVVLASEESDEVSAIRELEEEMGIAGVPLTFVGNWYWEDSYSRAWGSTFLTEWAGGVVVQPEEVADVRLMGIQEIIDEWQTSGGFCPDSMHVLLALLQAGHLKLKQ